MRSTARRWRCLSEHCDAAEPCAVAQQEVCILHSDLGSYIMYGMMHLPYHAMGALEIGCLIRVANALHLAEVIPGNCQQESRFLPGITQRLSESLPKPIVSICVALASQGAWQGALFYWAATPNRTHELSRVDTTEQHTITKAPRVDADMQELCSKVSYS